MLCTIQAGKKLSSREAGHCTLGGIATGDVKASCNILHMYHITTHSNNQPSVLYNEHLHSLTLIRPVANAGLPYMHAPPQTPSKKNPTPFSTRYHEIGPPTNAAASLRTGRRIKTYTESLQ